MKRRRHIAWVLFVVGMVMLAASVLPHHHHQHILCLHNDVSACECPCEDMAGHETSHHESCEDHCVTNFVSLTPEGGQMDVLPDAFTCLQWYACTDILSVPLPISIVNEDWVPLCMEKLYAACIQHVMGLRAPPCVG